MLKEKMEQSKIRVSLDPSLPQAALTAQVLLTTLRRLPVQLELDPDRLTDSLVGQLSSSVNAIDPEKLLVLGSASGHAVHLHVGIGAKDKAIRVVPEGYGAQIVAADRGPVTLGRPGNAVGAVFAAALGAAEAFKVVAGVLPERHILHGHLRFCPLSLGQDTLSAPELPNRIELEAAIVGLGAVGSAVALILSELPIHGRVILIDRERFGRENLGTYSLGSQRDSIEGRWKVDLAKAALKRDHLTVTSFVGDVSDFVDAVDTGHHWWPRIVLAGLDSVESRHAAQRLWPDRLVDMATGDTAIGLHDVRETQPCLMCFFPAETGGPSPLELLSRSTGLSVEFLRHGDRPLLEEHLAELTSAQRNALRPFLHRPVCGLADAFRLTGLETDGFRPAVPFISMQAAALGVARLLASQLNYADQPNLVQYDGLIGPEQATALTLSGESTCYCNQRSESIAFLRGRRSQRLTNLLGASHPPPVTS
jgi:hypothetical protein